MLARALSMIQASVYVNLFPNTSSPSISSHRPSRTPLPQFRTCTMTRSQQTSTFEPSSIPEGPLKTEGYVCSESGAPFTLQPVTLPSMTPTMVQADILIIGLCHTDIHMRDNDWGVSNYPLLAGHEAVATVTAIGSAVRNLSIGDRVAIAWIRDSCSSCESCLQGRENLCQDGYQGTFLGANAGVWGKSKLEYNKHGGCFVRTQRVEERFAVKLPDGLPNEIACPLLCGGGTVYEPLCDYGKPGSKVGIIGIGGLGTAAIKLGKLRGCVMYAISGSEGKHEAALSAGASEFVCSANSADVEAVKGKLDVLIDTTPVNLDITPLLGYLKMGGVYCRVGIMPAKDQTFSGAFIPLVFQSHRIAGSCVTGSYRMKEMLDLVAANIDFMKDTDIWKTEHVPIADINKAIDNLVNRKNKGYRYVLEW